MECRKAEINMKVSVPQHDATSTAHGSPREYEKWARRANKKVWLAILKDQGYVRKYVYQGETPRTRNIACPSPSRLFACDLESTTLAHPSKRVLAGEAWQQHIASTCVEELPKCNIGSETPAATAGSRLASVRRRATCLRLILGNAKK